MLVSLRILGDVRNYKTHDFVSKEHKYKYMLFNYCETPRCEADLSDIREEFIYKHLNPICGTDYCICISVIKQSRLEQSNKDTIAYSPETSMYDMIDYREEFSLIN